MMFVTKHYSENNNTFIFKSEQVDNYKQSFIKLDVKQAIINLMIDIGLVFSENGLSERLDIAKYKHILHT